MTSPSQSVIIISIFICFLLGIYYLTEDCSDCVNVPIQTITTRDYKVPAAKPTQTHHYKSSVKRKAVIDEDDNVEEDLKKNKKDTTTITELKSDDDKESFTPNEGDNQEVDDELEKETKSNDIDEDLEDYIPNSINSVEDDGTIATHTKPTKTATRRNITLDEIENEIDEHTKQHEWSYLGNYDHVKTYMKETGYDKLFAFRGVSMLEDIHISQALAPFLNITSALEWVSMLEHIERYPIDPFDPRDNTTYTDDDFHHETIEKLIDGQIEVIDMEIQSDMIYQVLNLPWPLSPRDILLERRIMINAFEKQITVTYQSIADKRKPETKEYIRAISPHTMWRFTMVPVEEEVLWMEEESLLSQSQSKTNDEGMSDLPKDIYDLLPMIGLVDRSETCKPPKVITPKEEEETDESLANSTATRIETTASSLIGSLFDMTSSIVTPSTTFSTTSSSGKAKKGNSNIVQKSFGFAFFQKVFSTLAAIKHNVFSTLGRLLPFKITIELKKSSSASEKNKIADDKQGHFKEEQSQSQQQKDSKKLSNTSSSTSPSPDSMTNKNTTIHNHTSPDHLLHLHSHRQNRGNYKFHTFVEIETIVDSKGNVPSWFFNYMQRFWPAATLRTFRKLAHEGKVPPHPKILCW